MKQVTEKFMPPLPFEGNVCKHYVNMYIPHTQLLIRRITFAKSYEYL